MTALSADRNTPMREGTLCVYPVAAATTIYAGSLVVLDASGNAEPASTATGKIAVGRAEEYVANAGAAAAKTVQVRSGVFCWVNGETITKAHIGDTAYALDDCTVYRTAAGKSAVGHIIDVDTNGVWVRTDIPHVTASTGLAAANNLSDVGSAATARGNLGLDTGDSPTFAAVTSTGAVTAGSAAIAGITATRTELLVKTDDYTVQAAAVDGFATVQLGTDNKTITLPDAAAGNKGMRVTIQNIAADGAAKISVSPHSSDKIQGQIGTVEFGGVANKDIVNTKATQKLGDHVTLISDGTDSWWVVGGQGVWASEG